MYFCIFILYTNFNLTFTIFNNFNFQNSFLNQYFKLKNVSPYECRTLKYSNYLVNARHIHCTVGINLLMPYRTRKAQHRVPNNSHASLSSITENIVRYYYSQ